MWISFEVCWATAHRFALSQQRNRRSLAAVRCSRLFRTRDHGASMPLTRRRFVQQVAAAFPVAALAADGDWPCFRGAGARGVADGHAVLASWNTDSVSGSVS